MCKAQNEGGQRCAAHAKKGIESAQSRFDRSGTEEDLQALVSAHVEYASTPEGHEIALANLAAGEAAPGDLDPAMWQRIADDGASLRERNQAVATAVREAATKGEAFRTEVQEKWGPLGVAYVPNGVRGPKSLAKFLNNENDKMRWAGFAFSEDFQAAERLDGVLQEIQAAPLDPQATFEQRVPRSEEERAAWADHLAKARDRNTKMGRDRQEYLIEHNERMARFGEHGYETDPSKVVAPLDTTGALVRIRNEDGSLSEQEYAVWRVTDHDTDADGATTLALLPLTEIENGPSDEGSQTMPEVSFRGEVVSKTGERYLTPKDVAPATEATVNKYGSRRLEMTEDRYITEIEPHKYHHTVRAWSIGGREVAKFDEFRAQWAKQNAPYSKPKTDGESATLGSRLKGLFTG